MAASDSTRAATASETGIPAGFFDAPFGTHAPSAVQRSLISAAQRSFLHRGKLRHLLTNFIAGLGAPLDVARNGCNYRIEGTNNLIEYGLLLHPDYNGPERRFLCEGLGPGRVAVDIGSNVGLYTLPLARTGAEVVAIDANPSMVARLRFNAAASGLDGVQVVHAAVSDATGTVSLSIRADDVAIVNVVEEDAGTVPMRPLADILADAGLTRVDALKIDIEGHEDKALAPFLATASEAMIPDRIVIERVGPDDYPACFAQFQRLGYEAVGRTKSNSLYQRAAARA